MVNSPWFVITGRALSIDSCGGAWVVLTRDVWHEEIGQAIEEMVSSFYGPVEGLSVLNDPLSGLTDEEYAQATCSV